MKTLFILLVVFQFKHWLCDYPLQRPYMLNKFKGGTAWILPLCAHAGVHALLTFIVTSICSRSAVTGAALAALDFVVHFAVDRVKAAPTWGGRWKPNEPYFWWALGADQAAHHLTHYFIIFRLLSN